MDIGHMNRLTRKILCWLLTLSITGVPFYSVSASQVDITSGNSCHEMSAGMKMDVKATGIADTNSSTQQGNTMCDTCCDSCICISVTSCHSDNSTSSAILIDLITTRDGDAKLHFTHFNELINNHNIAPELTPPIA